MGRKKINGPTYQVGDVLALHYKGKPDGRRVRVMEVNETWLKVQTVNTKGKSVTTEISLSTARPTSNGWHIVERDGRAAKWDAEKVEVVFS